MTAQTPRSVARKIGDSFSEEDIRARLESFRDARLMVEMDGHYLSLAVWRNRTACETVASVQMMQIVSKPRSLHNII